jgi:hypothetical protein
VFCRSVSWMLLWWGEYWKSVVHRPMFWMNLLSPHPWTPVHHFVQYRITEDHNLNIHCWANPKSLVFLLLGGTYLNRFVLCTLIYLYLITFYSILYCAVVCYCITIRGCTCFRYSHPSLLLITLFMYLE